MSLDPPVPAYTVGDGYISFPITTDSDGLMAAQLDFIAQQLPGWVSRDGHLEVVLLQSFAAMCAQTATVAAQVPLAVFNYLGTKLLNLPVQAGASATAPSTWVMVDSAGYTIPAGTVVGYQPTGDQLILFTTQSAVTVPPGSSSTAAGGVTLVAQTVGVAGNGLAAGPVTLVDSLAFVSSITSTAVTAGGVDPETQTAYLNRLSAELQLLTPRPILPKDFAALAPQTVGVGRALAIDGLNPGRVVTDGVTTASSTTVTSASGAFTNDDVGRTVTGGTVPAGATISSVTNATTIVLSAAPTASATGVTLTFGKLTGQARAITLGVVDSLGAACTSTVKTNLKNALAAQREANFLVSIIDPTFTSIDVTYTIVLTAGASAATVQSAINTALTAYLSPANWAGGTQTPPVWTAGIVTIRYLDLASLVHAVAGVDHINSLTFGVHGGSLGTADVTLTGDAPLPQTGTLTPTILTS